MTEEEKQETRTVNAQQFADMVRMLETDHCDISWCWTSVWERSRQDFGRPSGRIVLKKQT